MVGLECSKLAFHDVDQEAGDGASVFGVFSYDPGKLGVELRLACSPGPVAAGSGGVGRVIGDEVGGVFVSVGGEKPGCLESVADAEVLEAILHDVDEEVGDCASVVGPEFDYLG